MKLKNIHTRKNYLKLNEFLGGTSGGVGASDGFGNNAKLKDTILGSLINGIFKGVGWLWRKTKEKFVISKLKAQLVNELMRGVICFCFENNISLINGTEEEDSSNIIANTESGENSTIETITGTTMTGETLTNIPDMSKDEIIIDIKKYQTIINDYPKLIEDKKLELNTARNELSKISPTDLDKIKEKKSEIYHINKEIKQKNVELKTAQESIIRLQEKLKKMSEQTQSILNTIKKTCEDKYQFNPTGDNVDKAKELGAIPYTKYVEKFEKKIKPKFIKIGDEFTIIKGKDSTPIKVIDVNINNNSVLYKDNNGKEEEVSTTKLLPLGFKGFAKPKNEMENFLNKYSNNYSEMTPEQQEKMELIYMNYAILNSIRDYSKTSILEESFNFILEDNLLNTIGKKISTSGTAKVRPDDPSAGKMSIGRAISTKVGSNVTVGDILTKKDKQKYQKNKDDFKIDIYNVDLAKIENDILKMTDPDDVKLKVSSYVNPYNLKVIQISAEQLLAPKKGEGETDSKLRSIWNKEVAKIYAGFNYVMNIKKIDITKDEYGSGLNNDKYTELANNNVNEVKTQKYIGENSQKLPSLEEGFVNYKSMSDGKYCVYYFSEYKNKGEKSKIYNTTIAPVGSYFSKFGLVRITSCFLDVDKNSQTITNNVNFWNKFRAITKDTNDQYKDKPNVYLLFKNNQSFPKQDRGMSAKIFVINEFIHSDGVSYLYLKTNNNTSCNLITDNLLDKLDKKQYIFDIYTEYIRKFKVGSEFDTLKDTFGYSQNTDYQSAGKPSFLTTSHPKATQNEKFLIKLQEILEKE